MKKNINSLLLIGIIGIFTFGTQFALHYGKAVWGDNTIWWTPMPLTLPLSETGNHFKIFINNELLDNHIERGALFSSDSSGHPYPVAAGDVRVGINNWHKIKAGFLHSAVFAAFFLGISSALLIVGIIQMLNARDKDAGPAAP